MTTAWYETFFSGLYGEVLANHSDPHNNETEARLIQGLLDVRKGDCVLDLGCGMGRLTIPLARMGLEMTGVDLTASYLRQAREQARRGLGGGWGHTYAIDYSAGQCRVRLGCCQTLPKLEMLHGQTSTS